MEQYRPLHHITAKYGWINDPNGFCYYKGQYHLYAQHNPKGLEWGPMHWLHFTSTDLINWKEEGIALEPSVDDVDKEFGCFSGSIVVRHNKIYCFYTGANGKKQVQCLATSKDGHHFKKIDGNPILSEKDLPEGYLIADFRDPKVFLRGKYYYMLLASRHKDGYSSILLYRSRNLKKFSFVNVVKSFHNMENDGMIECPDIIFDKDRCALIYSVQQIPQADDMYQQTHSIEYQVGTFDEKEGKFEFVGHQHELDKGFESYASQTLYHNNENYVVYWNSVWGINYVTQKEGYVGQLSLVKKVRIEGTRLIMSFLDATPDIYHYEYALENDKSELSIDNLKLIFDKKAGVVTLQRKNMDVEITNLKQKNTDECWAHASLGDVVTIDLSIDNSCVEISINNAIHFAFQNWKLSFDLEKVKTKNITLIKKEKN